jgi:type IV pilus assembly protein PilM
LEFGGQTLRAAEASLQKGKIVVDKVYEFQTDPEMPSEISDEAFLRALGKALVVSALPAYEVLVRQLEVKLKKDSDIDAVLAFQAEPLLPYPIDNGVVDRIKLSETPDGTLLTLLAARKDHLQQHLDAWHRFSIEPESITSVPVALTAFSNIFCAGADPLFVLHIGEVHTIGIFIKDKKLAAAQVCFQGMASLIQAYAQDSGEIAATAEIALYDIDFNAMDPDKFPAFSKALETLRFETARTLFALGKQSRGQEIENILLTGEGAAFEGLGTFLCRSLKKKAVSITEAHHSALPAAQLQRFAIPIGAALTGLPSSAEQINFRQGEFAYPNPWKRYKKPAATYAVLCAMAAAAFYFLGNAHLQYQEDQLRKNYSGLLASMGKPYTVFEKEYEAKNPSSNPGENILTIEQLSQQDIRDRLQYLEKDLQSQPDIYPLLPNVPSVSDVLAWLATHPNVVQKDDKTNEVKPLLQLENFNYSLVKRPEQTKKQEKYQVKVEFEFSAATPKLAREFHDALIAPNSLVDPKGEIKWSTNRGFYRASFILKDKTIYPVS